MPPFRAGCDKPGYKGLVDAMMDSIPIVALTGQVSEQAHGERCVSGSGHLLMTHSATKHNFLVKKPATCRSEAFYVAASARRGAGPGGA